jgi:hypothetical protein
MRIFVPKIRWLDTVGKITIKHYLNTEVKEGRAEAYVPSHDGLELYDPETSYPVYLIITFNRKTTKLRSYTKVQLRRTEFNYYQKHGTYIKEKFIKDHNPDKYLRNELDAAFNSLDYFYHQMGGNQEEFTIKNVLDYYMLPFNSPAFFRKINWETFFQIDDPEYAFMGKVLKQDTHTISLLDFFDKTLKIDINTLLNPGEKNLLQGAVMFFRFLPKDKRGNNIGRLIDWYKNDVLKNSFREFVRRAKGGDGLYDAFCRFMSSTEHYGIRGCMDA